MDIAPGTRGHCARDPARARRDLTEIPPEDLAAARSRRRARGARARGARCRGREPDQLVRAGCLADRLPLPPARDPALRGRRPPAARGRRRRPTRTSCRRPPRFSAADGSVLRSEFVVSSGAADKPGKERAREEGGTPFRGFATLPAGFPGGVPGAARSARDGTRTSGSGHYASSVRRPATISSGDGGQPGMRRSTGSTSSRRPTISCGRPTRRSRARSRRGPRRGAARASRGRRAAGRRACAW